MPIYVYIYKDIGGIVGVGTVGGVRGAEYLAARGISFLRRPYCHARVLEGVSPSKGTWYIWNIIAHDNDFSW